MDTRWAQFIAGLAAAGGGAAALLSLTTARGYLGLHAGLADAIVRSPETATAVGVVIAIVIATRAPRAGHREDAAVSAIGLAGVALTVDSSMQSPLAAVGTAAIAGVAVGGLVRWTRTSPHALLALGAGAVIGATASFPLRHPLILVLEGPRPHHAIDTRSIGVTLAIIAVIALLVATGAGHDASRTASSRRRTELPAALGVTATAWALGVWFEIDQATRGWYWGWLLVPAVLVATVVLRGRGGSSLLVITLSWVVVTRSTDLSWIPDVRWMFLLVPLTAAGALVGHHLPRPEVVVALLIPCVATWLIIDGPLDRTFSAVALFVVPVLVTAVITAEFRRGHAGPGLIAVALTAVALWQTSPRSVEFFVTRIGGEPTTLDTGPYFVPQTLAFAAGYVVPAVLTLIVCVVALRILRRRTPDA